LALIHDADVGSLFGTHGFTLSQLLLDFLANSPRTAGCVSYVSPLVWLREYFGPSTAPESLWPVAFGLRRDYRGPRSRNHRRRVDVPRPVLGSHGLDRGDALSARHVLW